MDQLTVMILFFYAFPLDCVVCCDSNVSRTPIGWWWSASAPIWVACQLPMPATLVATTVPATAHIMMLRDVFVRVLRPPISRCRRINSPMMASWLLVKLKLPCRHQHQPDRSTLLKNFLYRSQMSRYWLYTVGGGVERGIVEDLANSIFTKDSYWNVKS